MTYQNAMILIMHLVKDCDVLIFQQNLSSNLLRKMKKKIDVNINKNFNFWKLDFMLLLIEYYKKYKQTYELKPTDNILNGQINTKKIQTYIYNF